MGREQAWAQVDSVRQPSLPSGREEAGGRVSGAPKRQACPLSGHSLALHPQSVLGNLLRGPEPQEPCPVQPPALGLSQPDPGLTCTSARAF